VRTKEQENGSVKARQIMEQILDAVKTKEKAMVADTGKK